MASPPTPGLGTTALIASTAAVATIATLSLLRLALYPRHPNKTLKSPLHTVIPSLTPAELDALDYKPDAFPGARDVPTPYGSVRVYEFGDPAGAKVLLLHGISTSCQTLTHVANLLAAAGRRVMLFDLFGRGFSDAPADLPHDARLYVAQALAALASSPLVGWTGDGARVRVVGYSMGGGIAAHFVAGFPGMVESLVLLAPAGMIRPERFGRVANAVFRGGWVPERVLAAVTRRRLQRPIASGVKGGEKEGKGGQEEEEEEELLLGRESDGPVGAALAEAADDNREREPSTKLEVSVLRYVQWMVKHHEGFIPSFMASLRDAPLMGQHEAYRRLTRETNVPVAFLFGRKDTVVDEKGYREDGLAMMGGEERVTWRVVDGGHDFPMTHAREAVEIIEEFWRDSC
ncbi:Protein phosphatase methylesterase 1 [Coniochaeta hoffmannii]|uniref:Protein phosphatase methylesterase 1 n=1 Tax=Coniochaeta hoffmannii TaxID=91930 RepID=A0AA38W078_9PEZI|nr:Protein phosphatase methylesterase 1 [Coniochaeta hoffmannii]